MEFYVQWCVALHQSHKGSYMYFEKLFFPAFEVNFLVEKLPQLVAIQIFQSSYISHGESLNHNILLHVTLMFNIFYKALYTSWCITKQPPKLVAKILATKFGFVPDF